LSLSTQIPSVHVSGLQHKSATHEDGPSDLGNGFPESLLMRSFELILFLVLGCSKTQCAWSEEHTLSVTPIPRPLGPEATIHAQHNQYRILSMRLSHVKNVKNMSMSLNEIVARQKYKEYEHEPKQHTNPLVHTPSSSLPPPPQTHTPPFSCALKHPCENQSFAVTNALLLPPPIPPRTNPIWY
jgi:hypothetical protein